MVESVVGAWWRAAKRWKRRGSLRLRGGSVLSHPTARTRSSRRTPPRIKEAVMTNVATPHEPPSRRTRTGNPGFDVALGPPSPAPNPDPSCAPAALPGLRSARAPSLALRHRRLRLSGSTDSGDHPVGVRASQSSNAVPTGDISPRRADHCRPVGCLAELTRSLRDEVWLMTDDAGRPGPAYVSTTPPRPRVGLLSAASAKWLSSNTGRSRPISSKWSTGPAGEAGVGKTALLDRLTAAAPPICGSSEWSRPRPRWSCRTPAST